MIKALKIGLRILEVAIIGLLFAVFFIILSPRLPTKNIFTTFTVPSGSMEPFVKTGAIALVNTKNPENIHIGDVIAFKSPVENNKTILHRIVDITDEGIFTKGDNNSERDNWIVPLSNVKGTLVTSIPYIGNIAAFIRTPLGFFLLVYTPGAFLLASYLLNIYEGLVDAFANRRSRGLATMIPVFLGIMTLTTFFVTKTAFARWTETATVSGISFVAATPTPTASPTSSPSPTGSPSASPSPTSAPSCTGGVDIQYDFEARLLIISVTVNNNEVILLSLPFFRNATVNYTLSYDTDTVPNAIIGSTPVNAFQIFNKKLFMGSCSSGTCIKHIVVGCPKLEVDIE